LIELFDGAVDPSAFRRLENLILFETIDSTNGLARGLIDHAEEEEVALSPCAITALTQTRGRGRRNRAWRSPRGGLYCTFLFAVADDWHLSHLPLSASLWVSEALGEAFGLSTAVKWPNDVLCRGKKVAGILAEARTRGQERHAAIGIGINVFGRPEDYGSGATTVEAEHAARPSISRLFGALCRRVDAFLAAPEPASLVERWTVRAVHKPGDPLTLRLDGEGDSKRLSGKFAGLNPDGFLRLETAEGETVICAGEVEKW
jgi:BirA family biotin operon repressor/biotin-[acetyl-CoA-carboxylase] ligase